jgi:hypothetical protein
VVVIVTSEMLIVSCVCVGGLRDIRDTFMDWLGSFANFTAEIMRDDDEDNDDWEW